MKLTLAEWMVLMDTLSCSLRFSDVIGAFGYTHETRKQVQAVLNERMKKVSLGVNIQTQDER